MFIGHFGVALASKKVSRRTSLGALFLGAQWVDLLWPVLLLVGLEHARIVPGITVVTPLDFYDYPITHSLLAGLLWGLLIGFAYLRLTGDRRGGLVVGALVPSHWLLDLVVHRPDLPVWPGGPKLGLGLWNSFAGTVVVESALFLAGLALYLRAHSGRPPRPIAFWSLIGFLVAVDVANYLGPPPPNMKAVAFAGLAMFLLVAWAAWADQPRSQPRSPDA